MSIFMLEANKHKALMRVDSKIPVDNVRKFIPGTNWTFTIDKTSVLVVSGTVAGEYVADENSNHDPTKPISFSSQFKYKSDDGKWRIVGGMSQGENIRDNKQHYKLLPVFQFQELEAGTYEVALTLRSGNSNLDPSVIATVLKDKQGGWQYEVIPKGDFEEGTPSLPATNNTAPETIDLGTEYLINGTGVKLNLSA